MSNAAEEAVAGQLEAAAFASAEEQHEHDSDDDFQYEEVAVPR
jgi:hypothetical protein